MGDRFLQCQSSAFDFLDEFRLVASTGQPTVDGGELDLIMFDTSLPQQPPDNWRRFNMAPVYHHRYTRNPHAWEVRIHTDSESLCGGAPCDGPFVVDPTQAVVVIVLRQHECGDFPGGEAVLVIRVAALVRHMSSTRSGERIPWDVWKRDVIVAEIPHRGISYIRTFVHGTRVLLITYGWQERYRFQAYDFSRWGCKALVRVGDMERERMVMPNPGKVWLPRTPNNWLEDMRTLGNSLVVCTVGNSQSTVRNDEFTTCARRIQASLAMYMSGSWPDRLPSGSRLLALSGRFRWGRDEVAREARHLAMQFAVFRTMHNFRNFQLVLRVNAWEGVGDNPVRWFGGGCGSGRVEKGV